MSNVDPGPATPDWSVPSGPPPVPGPPPPPGVSVPPAPASYPAPTAGPSWLPAVQHLSGPPLPPPPPGHALAPGVASAPAASGGPVRAPRRRRVAVVVLSVLLVASLAAGGITVAYLLRTTSAWQDTAAQWEHVARAHGAEVAEAQADLAATREQLATAQARITQLADEKAQLGDESAATQQLADYQARISQAAGDVATALATCIDGQQNLIGYLQNPQLYDAAALASFRADVEEYCGAARDANAALQAELTR